MPPGDFYTVAALLSAVFIAPFNRLAATIFVSWLIGHIAYLGGAAEPWINIVQHVAAAAVAFPFIAGGSALRTDARALAWALFAPMVAVDLNAVSSGPTAETWKAVLGLALLQLAVLPLGTDWRAARRKVAKWRSRTTGIGSIGGRRLAIA